MFRPGVVVALVSEDRRRGVLVELGCATHVAARKPPFLALARSIARAQLSTGVGVSWRHTRLDNGSVEEACRALGRTLGEEIRVRDVEHVGAPLEVLAAADGRDEDACLGAIVGVRLGRGPDDPALLDAAARAVVERKLRRGWRDVSPRSRGTSIGPQRRSS